MNLERKLQFLICTLFFYGVKLQEISESLNAFTVDLLSATNSELELNLNIALSPYTVWTLLSIIAEGARGNTAKQLENVLRIPGQMGNKMKFRADYANMSSIISSKDQDVHLDIYNSIFTTAEQKLKTQFRYVSKNFYKVDVQPIDFTNLREATETINKYVAQATRNRITNFIRPNDLNFAQIFILSTLYFKGAWMMPFNRSETQRSPFFDEKQNQIGEVDMMYRMGNFPYARIDMISAHAVELPYGKGDKMSMVVVLPYNDGSIQNLLSSMQKYSFGNILDTLDKSQEDFGDDEVKVYLPRFRIKSDLTLNLVLIKMGIIDVFDEANANLLGMFPHYLQLSRLIQNAEIEVNEEGTVATAASGASIANKSPPAKFKANKPFLYFIVNKPTKSIMFAGKLCTPP